MEIQAPYEVTGAEAPQQNQSQHTQQPQAEAPQQTPQTSQPQAEAPQQTPQTQQPQAENTQRTEADQVLGNQGLNLASFEQEYNQNGGLSQGSYDALAKAGIPRNMVDAYIAGNEAVLAKQVSEVQATVGGAEQYTALTEWAKHNLSEGEKQAFNKVTDSGDMALIKLAVLGLQAKQQAAEGVPPSLMTGNTGGVSNVGFRSSDEMLQAMSDKRYGRDTAYTADVERRTALSNFF